MPKVSHSVCLADPCLDNVMNYDETDVDCGGPLCRPCASHQVCMYVTLCCLTRFYCDSTCTDVSSPSVLQTCALDVDCGPGSACVGIFQLPSGIPYEYRVGDLNTCSELTVYAHSHT